VFVVPLLRQLFGEAHYGTVWGFLMLAPTLGSEVLDMIPRW
jgi:hypothetical protein